MKYPTVLLDKLEEVKKIIELWPVDIEFEDVIKWIMQFDSNDFDLAIRVIKNLNVIGFQDLNNALTIAYSKLERRALDKKTKISSKTTLFAGAGEGGKSGAMISYNFRLINELSEENFLDENSFLHIEKGRIENIVLIDDIISSGDQAIDEIRLLMEKSLPFGVKNIFLLTAAGMKESIKKVEEETGAYVFSAFEYDINDTVQSFDSNFYNGIPYENRNQLKQRLEYYGAIASRSALGYKGLGGLITFYYNTPNSTLPIVWSSLNSWIPLFRRTIRVNGIDSYYKQFDNLKNKTTHQKVAGKKELSIYVEGKTEESFFEALEMKLKERFNFEKINIIPLGGFFSEKLLENIEKFTENFIFILEDMEISSQGFRRAQNQRLAEYMKEKPHVFMKTLDEYFDLNALKLDDEYSKILPQYETIEETKTYEFKREFESRMFKRFSPSYRSVLFKSILPKYLNNEAFEILLKSIEEKLH
jgi:hypothetical protein